MTTRGHAVLVAGADATGLIGQLSETAFVAGTLMRDVVVLVPPAAGLHTGDLAAAEVRKISLGERPGPADNAAMAQLREAARGAAVIHAFGSRAGSMSVLVARALGRGRPRIVVTLDEPLDAAATGATRRTVRLALDTLVVNGADVVLTVGPQAQARERRLGSVRRTAARVTGSSVFAEPAVVPVAPPGESSRPWAGSVGPASSPAQGGADRRKAMRYLLGASPDAFVVLGVLRSSGDGPVGELLEAATRCAHPAVLWWLIGPGVDSRAWRNAVDRRGLSGRVVFLRSRRELAPLVPAADLVVSDFGDGAVTDDVAPVLSVPEPRVVETIALARRSWRTGPPDDATTRVSDGAQLARIVADGAAAGTSPSARGRAAEDRFGSPRERLRLQLAAAYRVSGEVMGRSSTGGLPADDSSSGQPRCPLDP